LKKKKTLSPAEKRGLPIKKKRELKERVEREKGLKASESKKLDGKGRRLLSARNGEGKGERNFSRKKKRKSRKVITKTRQNAIRGKSTGSKAKQLGGLGGKKFIKGGRSILIVQKQPKKVNTVSRRGKKKKTGKKGTSKRGKSALGKREISKNQKNPLQDKKLEQKKSEEEKKCPFSKDNLKRWFRKVKKKKETGNPNIYCVQ